MELHPAVIERLARLAPDQRGAATAPPSPVLCVAPAGSGKTTTLVARIAWLLASGAARPGTVAAITFNKPGHPLPARPIARAGCDAARPSPQLVGLAGRVRPDDRPPDRSTGARRRPADAFHVVVPSILGFGFSVPVSETGWSTGQIARAVAELVGRLGYERYGAHGGDIGAGIAAELSSNGPDGVVGVHATTDLPTAVTFAMWSGDPAENPALTPEHRSGERRPNRIEPAIALGEEPKRLPNRA